MPKSLGGSARRSQNVKKKPGSSFSGTNSGQGFRQSEISISPTRARKPPNPPKTVAERDQSSFGSPRPSHLPILRRSARQRHPGASWFGPQGPNGPVSSHFQQYRRGNSLDYPRRGPGSTPIHLRHFLGKFEGSGSGEVQTRSLLSGTFAFAALPAAIAGGRSKPLRGATHARAQEGDSQSGICRPRRRCRWSATPPRPRATCPRRRGRSWC